VKKTFQLKVENKKPERQADAIKHEIKKYITRERKKSLKDGFDYWDFDCKIGSDASSATPVHVDDISKKVDLFLQKELESFYCEILAKGMSRSPKKSDENQK
jgi:hypothetical protein